MRCAFFLVFLLVSCMLVSFAPVVKGGDGIVEAKGLANRILGEKAGKIEFKKIPPAPNGKNIFEIESSGGKIVISGESVNSMARGLGVYLRRFCHVSVSWDADAPIQLPAALPAVPKKVTGVCSVKNRFFFNYCTFGYTMPFWSWREWGRCIDWMALNGINAPLAVTGVEKVLLEVWKKQGFSKEQILSVFTDAAHLPWYHMNTIARWGGPCPESYVEHGYKLQKKILARERALGMRPILMAFNGRVPLELKSRYPNKKITVLGKGWGMFPQKNYTYFLDPYDPLFAKLQKSFIETEKELYGSDHLYGVDPFNEITPPSWEPSYLAKTAARIYETMSAADKDATWIQMGWLFYFDKHWTNERIKALLKAVPDGKLVMLDYYCESRELWKTTEAFFNVPFIWCYLGNFGGKECLAGPLPSMKSRFDATVKARGGKNLWGIGSTLEGFGVNMMTYEYLFDLPWSDTDTVPEHWIKKYAASRNGGNDPAVTDAWKLLVHKVYNGNSSSYAGGAPSHIRPRFEASCGFVIMQRNFKPSDLMDAWKLMMKASPATIKRDSFRYDLVNLVRQYLDDVTFAVRGKMREGYIKKDKEMFVKAGALMLDIMKDQEELVRSRPEFLMGRWITNAKKIGTNDAEKVKLAWSVRNILTTWGGRSCPLVEYANRDWDGLTRDYYMKRWKMFVDSVGGALRSGEPFNQNVFDGKAADFEWAYVNRTGAGDDYASAPKGDSWEIIKRLFKKYTALKLDKMSPGAHKTKIGGWTPGMLKKEYKLTTWDVSKYINSEGLCVITFDYTGGAHALRVRNARLKRGGVVFGEDLHEGNTGNEDTKNTFQFKIDEVVPAATYTLEAEIKAFAPPSQKPDSRGDVFMEIFPK